MLKKIFTVSLSLFLALPSVAGAGVYYTDPDCVNHGNGLSFACAESPGAAGAFNTSAGVTYSGANWYLFRSGKTVSAAYVNISTGGNSTTDRMVIGSYSAGGSVSTSKAVLDGFGNSQDRVINSTNKYYWTIQDLEITYDDSATQANRIGIACPSSGGTVSTDYDNIIQRVYVRDILIDESASNFANGIRAVSNGGLQIVDVTIDNISSDDFYGGGDNLQIIRPNFSGSGQGSLVTGDEIQLTSGTGWLVQGGTITHPQHDEKQAFNAASTAGAGVIEDVTLNCYEGVSSVGNCFYAQAPGTVARRLKIRGSGAIGPVFFSASSSGSEFYNNYVVATQAADRGSYVFVNDVNQYNNTFVYAGSGASTGYGIHEPVSITGGVQTNNIISGFATGIRSTNSTDNYNAIYGATTDCADSDGTERACGASTLTTNPLLDSQGRPTPKSPAIDAGYLVDTTYCGRGNEIGAWELCPGDRKGPLSVLRRAPDKYSLGGGKVHAALVWDDALTWNDSNTWAD